MCGRSDTCPRACLFSGRDRVTCWCTHHRLCTTGTCRSAQAVLGQLRMGGCWQDRISAEWAPRSDRRRGKETIEPGPCCVVLFGSTHSGDQHNVLPECSSKEQFEQQACVCVCVRTHWEWFCAADVHVRQTVFLRTDVAAPTPTRLMRCTVECALPRPHALPIVLCNDI